ncbi:formimidoylglutamase [Enterovibrio nigricans]|uniref:Formimidoylglutamase n=1 Tax=Enterovibrio nigricans DSM 22720 TaxID=1121868 RepID=A0A1T4VNU7_9GAMM|nr:formimidoylglutamase [Enterovibrio nigricans]PKF49565.1 formimidoylglutamase [Enterovibrio nigricans]SKA66528.1 formiminoglutamase [Enterovibrio nigricans DSM 22720]
MTVDMKIWSGRVDDEDGDLGQRFHQRVQSAETADEPGIMLIGFACDEGVSRNKGRTGAYAGPNKIRRALANLPSHKAVPLYDVGNVCCDDHDLCKAQKQLADTISAAIKQKHIPIVLGGGHEVAWGSFQGLANHFQQKGHHSPPNIGIINFDAHFDLRTPHNESLHGSSGTPFAQIAEFCTNHHWPFHYACIGVSRTSNTQALFDKASALSVFSIEDTELHTESRFALREKLRSFIDRVDAIYLTIDLDVLPAAVAPGVSAPATHGVDYPTIELLVRDVVQAKDERNNSKLKLADIAELNPRFDIDDQTARIAARLVWTITNYIDHQKHQPLSLKNKECHHD